MRVFFFGAGYCARRLIAREPWIEASGTARSAERVAALRAEGVDAYAFDGQHVDAGLDRALKQGGGDRRLDPAAGWVRRDARALRRRHRRRAGPAADRLLFDHRRLWRPRRRLGRRDERDADPDGPRARAAQGRGALDGGGPARGASKPTSCVSPESTGPAATRSSICARARRAGSSSRGRCSTGPMSTTSPNSRVSC